MNVNVTNIHNVYNTTVVNNTTINRVSFNGGNGGVTARPTPQEEAAEHDRHIPPSAAQTQHVQAARGNPELRASANHGKPPIAATEKPGEFTGHGVVQARDAGAPYKADENHAGAAPHADAPAHPAVHPNDLPPVERPTPPNSGNASTDSRHSSRACNPTSHQLQRRSRGSNDYP